MELHKRGIVILKDRVKEIALQNIEFTMELHGHLHRFEHQDWGSVADDQREQNYKATENNDIIIGEYMSSEGNVWLVSNETKTKTAIIFPEDYNESEVL